MESLQNTHPDWDRYVGLADRCDDVQEFSRNLFDTVLVESLPLPDRNAFLFRYGIMELNTAIKPYMFSHLRKQGYEHIIYIDPDILVFDRLSDVEQLLNEGAAAVVTPHLTAPIKDQFVPTELDIMRAGAYNLGFLALGNQPESDAFIQWWEEKLEFGAVSDPARGLFTDQKWIDLAPGMFGNFAILRDPGYNVAYWNLAHRPIKKVGSTYQVNNHPLRFFHFSGFDPINPKPFSKHQNRFDLETIGEAKSLALMYAKKYFRMDSLNLENVLIRSENSATALRFQTHFATYIEKMRIFAFKQAKIRSTAQISSSMASLATYQSFCARSG